MFCGAFLGDETAPQEACHTLPLQQARDCKTEEEEERHNNGGTLCILASGDVLLWCHSKYPVAKQGMCGTPCTEYLSAATSRRQLCCISACAGHHVTRTQGTHFQSRVQQTKLSVLLQTTNRRNWNCSRYGASSHGGEWTCHSRWSFWFMKTHHIQENTTQEARLTLPLKQAVDSKAEK